MATSYNDSSTPLEQSTFPMPFTGPPNLEELPSLWNLLERTFGADGSGIAEVREEVITPAASKRAKLNAEDWKERLPGIAPEDFRRDPCILLAIERLQRMLKSLFAEEVTRFKSLHSLLVPVLQEVKVEMTDAKEKIRRVDNALREIDKLSVYVWEQVNIGHWKTVSPLWRKMYTLIAILKATFMIFQACGSKEIIKECDMGLIMGEPILNHVLTQIAEELSTRIILETNYLETFSLAQVKTEVEESPPTEEANCDDVAMDLSDLGNICLTEIKTEADEGSFKQEVPFEVPPSCAEFPLRNKSEGEFPLSYIPTPCLMEFLSYVRGGQPVVILETFDHWPAMKKWNVDYIDKVAGFRTVPVEIGQKYTSASWTQKVMTISEFIEKFLKTPASPGTEDSSEIGYLAQYNLFSQLPHLRQDIEIPTLCGVREDMTLENVQDAVSKPLEDHVEVNAWFGPANTISPCHYDPKNNILVQVFGEKVIRLYPPCETPHLQPHPETSLLFNTSQLDVEQEDLFEICPEMQHASHCDVVLHAGEALFIPPKWWHYVKSLSPSFSVSFWF